MRSKKAYTGIVDFNVNGGKQDQIGRNFVTHLDEDDITLHQFLSWDRADFASTNDFT